MDWCVDTRVRGASDRAESEIAAHLGRHAAEPEAVEAGRAAVHRAFAEAAPGPMWVTLDWSGRQSVLRLRQLPPDTAASAPHGPGVTTAHEEAGRLAAAWRDSVCAREERLITLGVARDPERDVEPPPDPPPGRGFQVHLSLQLPRDRLSVPITRHLIRAAMDEIGVVADDADAVDLALTEACANVIDHSGPGDAYDVAVSMIPSACHIRVIDVGRGFDHQALSLSRMAGDDAEHGRGLTLMRALVDQVRFDSEPERGTVVHLVKGLTFEASAAAYKLMGEGEQE